MQEWHVDLKLLKAEHVSGFCVHRSCETGSPDFVANEKNNPVLFEAGVRAYLNAYSQNVICNLIDKLGLDINLATDRINKYLKVTEMVGKISKPSNGSLAMKIQCEGVPKLLSVEELTRLLKPENVCPFWVSMSFRASVNVKVSKNYGLEILSKKVS
ncbi:MAG: hypothetical protein GY951_07620 [Psychromonas sp.]|nr:hypothetical protein [Psychromonas sp.]